MGGSSFGAARSSGFGSSSASGWGGSSLAYACFQAAARSLGYLASCADHRSSSSLILHTMMPVLRRCTTQLSQPGSSAHVGPAC